MNRELSIGNWGGMSRRNWRKNPPEDALSGRSYMDFRLKTFTLGIFL